MKFSSACLVLLAQPASAFVGQSQRAGFRPLNVVTDPTETVPVNGAVATVVVEPPKAADEEGVAKVEMPKPEPVKKEAPKPAAKAAAPSFFIEEKQAPLEP